MVRHDIRVRGVDLSGNEQKPPIVLQMNDDDFPARFLQDLASPGKPQLSQAMAVPSGQPLYQPVQRMLNLALVDLNCVSVTFPRLDPTRILSAGLVVRRIHRQQQNNNGQPSWDDPNTLAAWMQSPSGQFKWVRLAPGQENLDPDPTRRPQLSSGQPETDSQLAALALSTAYTESTTPAFAAPPATCASLGRTIVYAVVPTASSEVSDTQPSPPTISPSDLLNTLPQLLRYSQSATTWPAVTLGSASSTTPPPPTIDYHWLSDDFVNAVYPPLPSSATPPLPTPSPQVVFFQGFNLALRMLHTVFSAFDGSSNGNAILAILNRHNVSFQQTGMPAQGIGDFFQSAKVALLDYMVNSNPYPGPAFPAATQLPMPASWDPLTVADQNDLLAAMTTALAPLSTPLLAPRGRFQDSTRSYKLRVFFRIKGETQSCPPQLVWSHYSDIFQIAPWHATGQRSHPPIPLPDPISAFVQNAKPNCTFQVPGNLMSAIQGTSLSNLMNGSGGGGSVGLGWICGFNIPLITICAFFVLNIFLSLLNIIFFWLPFIKICIPIPESEEG